MKAAAHRATTDLISISSCHWQLLKTRQQRNKNISNDQCGRGQRLPRARQRHSACRVGEFVYVFGGKDGTSPLKDIWKYHIGGQTWEVVELHGGSLPLLQGHTAVAYKRFIMIFGGTFNNNANDVQLWIFNPDLDHLWEVWIEPGAAQPLCQRDHSAVIHNNFMYVFGGFKDPTGASQDFWAFNIDEEEWTDLTHLSRCKPSGRYGHTAVVADNAMWLFGGMAGLSPCTDFWRYSFLLHQWSKLKYVGSPPSLSGHSACVIYHQMIVVGGCYKGKPVNDVWSFRFDTNTWQKVTSGMQLPALSSHACVPVNPLDARSHTTDRALSTPHLKPSTHLLHPDRFVVRPHTSPSVLEDTSPRNSYGDGREHSWVEDTQVISIEELNSVTIELENINSINRSDPRIDVSLEEPLMSDSPATTGFCDSCIPFSPRQNDEVKELKVLQHNKSLSYSTDSDNIIPGRTVCPGGGTRKAVTIDLIDACDSPVLKASKHNFKPATRGKQRTFWNDLFLEDLETSDEGDLDEVKISYPSRNSALPPSCRVISDVEELVVVEDMLAQQQRNQTTTSRQQTNDSLWSRQRQEFPHSQLSCQLTSEVKDGNSTRLPQSAPPGTHSVHIQQDEWSQLQSQTHCKGHFTEPAVLCEQDQCLPSNKGFPVILHRQPEQDRKTYSGQLNSSEAETSFTDSGDSAQSEVVTAMWNSGVASGHAVSGTAVTPSDHCLAASSSKLWPRETSQGVSGAKDRKHGAEGRAKEETVLEDPFLLVLGGRMEEQVSIYPKPIAVWKGCFV